jgi:hypothetical protein
MQQAEEGAREKDSDRFIESCGPTRQGIASADVLLYKGSQDDIGDKEGENGRAQCREQLACGDIIAQRLLKADQPGCEQNNLST